MSAPNTVVVAIENNGATQIDRVRSVSSAETAAIITWQQLTVTAKDSKGNNKELLKDVCGYVEPGHMLAIMGPSGCGKTTMLDTLAGRLPGSLSIAGEVLINGYKSNLCYGKSAYVTQSESLIGTLSVQEALTYAALLRLPSSMTYAEKVDRVAEVLNEMGLSDAKHTLIGNWYLKGISGGQKRRLSIACELVTHPTLLFLDEPTSGLDAASAFYVMATIRRLAERGRTVLTVIHQPSSEVFDLFDQLCLLSKGNVVYFGAADQALDMFEAAGMPCPMLRNPTDHFLHMINDDFHKDEAKEVGQLLQRVMSDKTSATASQAAAMHHDIALATVADDTHATGDGNTAKLLNAFNSKLRPLVAFKAKELSARTVEYQGNQNQAGFMYQNYVLTKRMLLNNLRNIGVFWLRLAMFIILCIMMGTIYLRLGKSYKDTYSYTSMLFFCVAFLTFMAIAGFPTFAEDMEIFIAERMNGYYGVLTFVIANTIASAPFLFLIAVLSTIIVYWLVNLNDQGDRFPYFFINLYTALTVVESLMMAIAAIVPHFLMGIAMGAGMLGMFMLVCGFFQPVSQLPAPVWHYPLHYMSFHSYNFGGFMQNQFLDTYGWGCQCSETAQGCDAALYNATHPCTMTGQEVLDWWTSGAGTLNKWVDIGILWAMVLIYRAIFFFMLKLKERLRSG